MSAYLQIIWKQKAFSDNGLVDFVSLKVNYIILYNNIKIYVLVFCGNVKCIILCVIFSFSTRHFYYRFVKQQL